MYFLTIPGFQSVNTSKSAIFFIMILDKFNYQGSIANSIDYTFQIYLFIQFTMKGKQSSPKFLLWTDVKKRNKFHQFGNQNHSFVGCNSLNLEEPKVVVLDQYDPQAKYTVVYPGLNIQGTCENKACQGYHKDVWVKKGYGQMNFSTIITFNKCPCCEKHMQSNSFQNLGFTNAKVTFNGVKFQGGKIKNIKNITNKKQDSLSYSKAQQILSVGYLWKSMLNQIGAATVKFIDLVIYQLSHNAFSIFYQSK